jgi:GNAT superfamily N-acetyltransferase
LDEHGAREFYEMPDHHSFTCSVSSNIDPAFRRSLQGILRDHNAQASTLHGPEDTVPLTIYARDDQGHIVGGIVAQTYWNWLVIDLLAVTEEKRGRGLGRRLMEHAEAEARSRGCTRSYTTTYAHQALEFYQRLGYQIAGQLDDYPEGCSLYWLHKHL